MIFLNGILDHWSPRQVFLPNHRPNRHSPAGWVRVVLLRQPQSSASGPWRHGRVRRHRRAATRPRAALLRPQRTDRARRCPRGARLGEQRILNRCRGARSRERSRGAGAHSMSQCLTIRRPDCRLLPSTLAETAMTLDGRLLSLRGPAANGCCASETCGPSPQSREAAAKPL